MTGAFTGAVGSRDGAFQQAHRGTLFLDEVAELPHSIQVKLLRVVEDGVVRPLGGRPATVDVRIVSASWADLAERVKPLRDRHAPVTARAAAEAALRSPGHCGR